MHNLTREVMDSPSVDPLDSEGQSADLPCLEHAFAKKGWTRGSLRSLSTYNASSEPGTHAF